MYVCGSEYMCFKSLLRCIKYTYKPTVQITLTQILVKFVKAEEKRVSQK